jgi:hypothetical protein
MRFQCHSAVLSVFGIVAASHALAQQQPDGTREFSRCSLDSRRLGGPSYGECRAALDLARSRLGNQYGAVFSYCEAASQRMDGPTFTACMLRESRTTGGR